MNISKVSLGAQSEAQVRLAEIRDLKDPAGRLSELIYEEILTISALAEVCVHYLKLIAIAIFSSAAIILLSFVHRLI